jgi:hypothetical protein
VLAKRPDLLLLDEPLANLDPLARRDFLTSMFASCAESGVAVLFSSHVIAELERICDYLIVLRSGRIQVAGDIDELRAAHRVVTGPLGWPTNAGITPVSATHTAGRTAALRARGLWPAHGPGPRRGAPDLRRARSRLPGRASTQPRRGAGMRCLMWRQHRGQLLWTAALLATYCALMAVVGHSADRWLANYHHWLAQLRAAGCPVPSEGNSTIIHAPPAACRALLERYRDGEQSAFATAYNFAIPVFEEGLPLAMVIIGVLVGAPLVAREVEQRSQLVAWTQSITRRRWYTTKIGVLATGLALAGLLAGFSNDWLQMPLTRGGLTSSRWPWFFSIGVAPRPKPFSRSPSPSRWAPGCAELSQRSAPRSSASSPSSC